MTERVDVFTVADRSFELPVMGIFEITNGRISAWRDNFDCGQAGASCWRTAAAPIPWRRWWRGLGPAVSAGSVAEAAGCAMVALVVPWASIPAAVAGRS